MARHRLTPWILGACALFLALLALPGGGARAGSDEPAVVIAAEGDEAPAEEAAAEAPPSPPPSLGEMRLDPATGRYAAPLGEGRAVLTLDAGLQQKLTKVLADYRVPWGATVLLEPRSGRILAMAEHSQREKGARDLALRAIGPAASVFKIVTAAALLEQGVQPEETVCYHGGKHAIARKSLADDPRRDRRCLSLAAAMGQSANLVFAKLADRGLGAEALRAEAERWLFNAPLPFVRPVEVSRAEIPDDPFDLARTAAGFGQVRLSALHAALIAAVVANGGVLVPPELVDQVEGAAAFPRPDPVRVVDEPVAQELARMMRTTITEGTARKVFRRDRWSRRSPLREVAVAGKTGSLAERSPFRDYSWFVGFAPADDPQVAVATVVVNERLWRVRAPWVAHHALETYFGAAPARPVALVGAAGSRRAPAAGP
jgi:cell division protein FtsI/penicillin-binding protein 2